MAYFYLALAFTLNGIANILLKLGAERISPPIISAANLNWQISAGVALFAFNIVFYALALRALPLAVAYPVMAATGFLIVNGFAYFGLGENISLLQVVGYVAIIAGLVLVLSFSRV